jgi:hypothetical protein
LKKRIGKTGSLKGEDLFIINWLSRSADPTIVHSLDVSEKEGAILR